MILVLFYLWEDIRIWSHWNDSLDTHLNYLGPIPKVQRLPVFLHPAFPSGCMTAGAKGLILIELEWATFFSFPVTSLNCNHFTHLENQNNRSTCLMGSWRMLKAFWVRKCASECPAHLLEWLVGPSLSFFLTMPLMMFLVRKAPNQDQHPDFCSPQTAMIKATTALFLLKNNSNNFLKTIKTWHI